MRNEAYKKKVDGAVKLIRSSVGDDVVEVSYSGGKDSDVILELVKMAGVKYRAIYKNTTIDPPGTIAHVLSKGVEVMRPQISFFQLIEKKGFPTRRARFCCEKLKEYKVLDKAVQGIRRCESSARSKRYSIEEPVICRIYGSKKNHVNVILPILDWTDEDIALFVSERNIRCHPLYYDTGGAFHPERRLGCMGCPMSQKAMQRDFHRYPRLVKLWIKAGQKWWDAHPNISSRKKFKDIYELFVNDVFFDSYEDFRTAADNVMFGSVDCKKFLEQKYNIKF